MNQFAKKILENTALCTVLALTALMLLSPGMAGAQGSGPQFLDDGAVKFLNGWDLPAQGTCPADTNQATRPLCVALRLNIVQASCVSPNYSWSNSGLCNDLDPAVIDEATCEAKGDRLWNSATSKCAIVMTDDDRNAVVCALHGGTYEAGCTGVWVMPAGSTYNPPLLQSSSSTGDQCLRCHNTKTQYNGPRVRDTEDTLFMGHKNMARKVTPGQAWGGPPLECTILPSIYLTSEACLQAGGQFVPVEDYHGTDSGQDFNWATGQIDVDLGPGVVYRDLLWIYADWIAAYPRAIFEAPAGSQTSAPTVCSDPRYTVANCVANGGTILTNAGASYSCARCHTTGWTSDATIKTTKEPERSFPGVTWNYAGNAPDNVVNLAGGINNDPNQFASWDVFGITCSRCHASALNNDDNVPPFTAPTGMSAHHNNLTIVDMPGSCSISGVRNRTDCLAQAGTWTFSGYCTDPRFTAKTQCEAGIAGLPSEIAPGAGTGIWVTACSNNNFGGSQSVCEAAGGTWTEPLYGCTVAGVCNKSAYTTQTTCTANGGQWAKTTDVITCEDAGGHWTGSVTQRGQLITALCMNCHRQETKGMPYDNTAALPGDPTVVKPGENLKVGPYHGTVPFLSHPHGNQFLNSPHANFTGTFSQIGTGKFNGYLPGEYNSYFMEHGEAEATGNGCTGCHDVHNSTVSGDLPFREECTECHAKDLSTMLHPGGVGTPLEEMATDPMEACVSCHMPEGEHLFRINVDPLYKTRPTASMTTTVNATTAPDGDFEKAVWVDLDAACGKCHGGGIANVVTTGSITANTKLLTVPNGALFSSEQRIEIKGAGSPYYDDEGQASLNNDFETYVVSVAGNVVTLAGNATKTVTDAVVEQNPVKNGAAYMSKTNLAVLAKEIHNDKPYVSFTYTLTPGNSLQVNVNASFSTCSGDLANCDAFDWNWGDATMNGSGVTTSHTYAAAGTYVITLTVHQYGVGEASKFKNVRVFTPDGPPVAGGTACVDIINPNTWVATLVDNSTDPTPASPAGGIKQVAVNWGDGGSISSVIDPDSPYSLIGTVFTRTYLNAASVTIKQTAYDTVGQKNVRTCPPVVLSTFGLSGNARRLDNTPVASVKVVVKKGAVTVRTVYTNALGDYSVGNLKPGTYNITATKAGLTFPQVYNQPLGPSAPGLNFQATN